MTLRDAVYRRAGSLILVCAMALGCSSCGGAGGDPARAAGQSPSPSRTLDVPEVTWDVDPFCPEAHDWAYASSQFWVASALQLRHSMPGFFEDQLAATRGLAEHAPKAKGAFFERSARWLDDFGAVWTRAGWRWQGVDASSPYVLPQWSRRFEVTVERLRSCDIRDDLRAGIERVLFRVQSIWDDLSPADQMKITEMLGRIGLSPQKLS